MRDYCLNKKSREWEVYGGRGITICQSWLDSFEQFLSDMGDKPLGDYCLGRIDSDKNFDPSNCKWITKKQRWKNNKRAKYITYKEETHSMSEWEDITGFKSTLRSRIVDKGWPIEDAFEIIPDRRNAGTPVKHRLTIDGITKSVVEWARELNLNKQMLLSRARRGWSLDRILNQPIRKRSPNKPKGH
jgi:hypothetical protein